MFGIYRTFLALLVVVEHVGDVSNVGAYAVFGFYMLSGYLMTFILHKNYGYTFSGVFRYGLNRFLRIYPIYWLAAGLSLALLLVWGTKNAMAYHPELFMPSTRNEIIKNVLIAFPYREAPRLVPPAWALTVELFYYLAIGLGLSRFRFATIIWFASSVVYHMVANYLGLDWNYKYFSIPAASLPFSTGAIVYHFRESLLKAVEGMGVALHVAFGLVIACFATLLVISIHINSVLIFYLSYLFNALIIIYLVSLSKTLPGFYAKARRLDGKIGDLSYPIYLIHFQVGIIVIMLAGVMGHEIEGRGLVLLFAMLPLLFPLAWLLASLVEKPLDIVREKVKKSAGLNFLRIV